MSVYFCPLKCLLQRSKTRSHGQYYVVDSLRTPAARATAAEWPSPSISLRHMYLYTFAQITLELYLYMPMEDGLVVDQDQNLRQAAASEALAAVPDGVDENRVGWRPSTAGIRRNTGTGPNDARP